MRRLSLLFLCVVVLFGLSMTTSAQQYAPNPPDTTLTFIQNVGGLGIGGIYQGTLDSNPTVINFICADDTHTIGPSTWPVDLYSLTNLVNTGAYAYVGFNPTYNSAQQAWSMEAYLEGLVISGYGTLDAAKITAMNYAIWSITNPNGAVSDPNSIDPGFDPAYYIGQAAANWQAVWNAGAPGITFYVPTGTGNNPYGPPQIFSSTPEPLSMALMGTFLTLVGLALGKKKLFS